MSRTRQTGLCAAALAVVASLLLAGLPAGARADVAGWYRVAFAQRITHDDRTALDALGAEGVQYVPTDAYVAWLTAEGVRAVAELPGVAGVGAVVPADKIDRHLPEAGTVRVAVLVHERARREVARHIATVATVAAEQPAAAGSVVATLHVAAPAAALGAMAALPEVLAIGPSPTTPVALDEASVQIQAGNHAGGRPVVGYEPWLQAVGLDGNGVRVSITDTGVAEQHPDLGERVVAHVGYSPRGSDPGFSEPTDLGGHGTHVAGIVGGDATSLSGVGGPREADGAGFLYGLGVAPAVELVDQAVISMTSGVLCGNGFWPPPYPWSRITRDALANDASIWNASWQSCEGSGVGYIASSAALDALVRDGDPETEAVEPFTMVFAAGNSGNGNGRDATITAPSESKNTIVVGSSRSSRAGNIETISGFSSRGPAHDGRVVPIVVAPGQSVISARSPGGTLSCSVPVQGSVLYSSCSGTSMAAPHVTGAVALLTQWWREAHDGADPSPAMAKALLVNTAVDMGEPDVPNRDEGWGRVDLGALFDASASRVLVDQDVVLTELDEDVSFRVAPADPSRPVRATLVWTDVPGLPGAERALVNDLDLVVDAPDGTRYHGNAFDGGSSVPGEAADRVDNTENVFLAEAADGTYTITVRAANLPGDGVLAHGDTTDQHFALVLSNAVEVA